MIVLKFGGTSVQDRLAMNQVLDISSAVLGRSPLLVSSAMAGVTNRLLELVQLVEKQDKSGVEAGLQELEHRHYTTLSELATGANYTQGQALLSGCFDDLRALVKGSILLSDCSPRIQDAIAGTGERLATILLWARCLERQIEAELLDSRQLIVTDDHFGEAAVLMEPTRQAVRQRVRPQPGKLLIAQGFVGATVGGVSTVLGRGGSDYSASLFGAALGAEEVQIWTDVNGIMTTDPRKVPTAHSIPSLTYAEAAELAFFGAKVVHPATIQPAIEQAIPVWVKNTKNPDHPGTKICAQAPGDGLRAIAGRSGVTLITVTSSRMLNAYGFLRRIFEIFDRFHISVDLVATSEVSVSMTVAEHRSLHEVVAALEHVGSVKLERGAAILCLVGQDLWKDSALVAKVFAALPDCSLRLISLGASEINLSIVLLAHDLDRALQAVHKAFFGT